MQDRMVLALESEKNKRIALEEELRIFKQQLAAKEAAEAAKVERDIQREVDRRLAEEKAKEMAAVAAENSRKAVLKAQEDAARARDAAAGNAAAIAAANAAAADAAASASASAAAAAAAAAASQPVASKPPPPPPPPKASPTEQKHTSNVYSAVNPTVLETSTFRDYRSSGTAYSYVVKFDPSETIGLDFDMGDTNDGFVVTAVLPNTQSSRFGVVAGDILTSVCAESVLSLSAKKLAKIISQCEARSIGFVMYTQPAPTTNDVTIGGPIGGHGYLHITEPPGFAGVYNVPITSWGAQLDCAALSDKVVVDISIVESDVNLCADPTSNNAANKPSSNALNSSGDREGLYTSSILFTKRGVCAMLDKSIHASRHKSSALIIVNSDDDGIAEIPAGPMSTDDVDVVLGSVGQWADSVIHYLRVMNDHNNDHDHDDHAISAIRGYMSCTNHEPELLQQITASVGVSEQQQQQGYGRIAVSGNTVSDDAPLLFVYSMYNPVPAAGYSFVGSEENVPLKMVRIEPRYACSTSDVSVSVKNSIVAVVRGGGCDFVTKVTNVQSLGGLGVVVINDEEGQVMQLIADEESMDKIHIPVGMVGGEAWEKWFGKDKFDGFVKVFL
jgi:hypothetical protein